MTRKRRTRRSKTGIITVKPQSDELAAVQQLHKRNSATLGFFPTGAFEDYAARGWIHGLSDADGLFAYVACRVSGSRAVLAHLCVDEKRRGSGAARRLLAYLRESLPQTCLTILLRCRRDFDAAKAWPSLGFTPVGEVAGRGKGGNILTVWALDLGHPDLFSASSVPTPTSLAIDAHVFFDLSDENRRGAEDSRALQADWVADDLEICVTSELLVEINRNEEAQDRDRLRRFARSFKRVAASPEDLARISQPLIRVLGKPSSERAWSDIRHLAHAAAEGVPLFATRENRLLKKTEEVFHATGLRIVHPKAVLTQLDELAGDTKFQPARLAGTRISQRSLTASEVRDVGKALRAADEKAGRLYNELNGYLADRLNSFLVARHPEGQVLAARVLRLDGDTAHVPFLRANAGTLTSTLSRHLLEDSIRRAADYGAKSLVIAAKGDEGEPPWKGRFLNVGGDWVKPILRGGIRRGQLGEQLRAIKTKNSDFKAMLKKLAAFSDDEAINPHAIWQFERLVWPGRLVDADIPTFLVPIRPVWAAHLFDTTFAAGLLFGADENLALRTENVYYRSAKPSAGLRAPARILWYVSKDPRYPGSQMVRACSTLEEVDVDLPKRLFRRFERLGVFAWKDVYEVAKKDERRPVMALRFGQTELLPRPVPRAKLMELLENHQGSTHPLVSPVLIGKKCFRAIFEEAM